MKVASIGQRFASGSLLNKGGNVVIKYNRHAHIRRNAAMGSEESEIVNTEPQDENKKYCGEIPYQSQKAELYEKYARELAAEPVVLNNKSDPHSLADAQRSELERLQSLAEARQKAAEEELVLQATEQRKRRLQDELNAIQWRSQQAVLGSASHVAEREHPDLLQEDILILQGQLEAVQTEQDALKQHQRNLLLERTMASIQVSQEAVDSPRQQETSKSKAKDKKASRRSVDSDRSHVQQDACSQLDSSSGFGQTNLDTNGPISYARIHQSSHQQVQHILNHVKHSQEVLNPIDSSVKNYSFHKVSSETKSVQAAQADDERSVDSSSAISSLGNDSSRHDGSRSDRWHMPLTKDQALALYVEQKCKQKYDTKFSHVDRRKEMAKIVVNRSEMLDAVLNSISPSAMVNLIQKPGVIDSPTAVQSSAIAAPSRPAAVGNAAAGNLTAAHDPPSVSSVPGVQGAPIVTTYSSPKPHKNRSRSPSPVLFGSYENHSMAVQEPHDARPVPPRRSPVTVPSPSPEHVEHRVSHRDSPGHPPLPAEKPSSDRNPENETNARLRGWGAGTEVDQQKVEEEEKQRQAAIAHRLQMTKKKNKPVPFVRKSVEASKDIEDKSSAVGIGVSFANI